MNTNRTTKLSSRKAIKMFGPRKGAATYFRLVRSNRQRKLARMMVVPSEKVSAAFKRMAAASSAAAMDFHEFAKFLHHGPTIVKPCGDNPWFDKDTGSPGVSAQELTTLAQQYAYLHPQK